MGLATTVVIPSATEVRAISMLSSSVFAPSSKPVGYEYVCQSRSFFLKNSILSIFPKYVYLYATKQAENAVFP